MALTQKPVVTESGAYIGRQKDGYRAYLGIGYAKPPVGELRFAPPQKPEASDGVVKADHFGNRCICLKQFHSVRYRISLPLHTAACTKHRPKTSKTRQHET